MSTNIIKEPDGKYGLFATIGSRIFAFNRTPEELIEIWKRRAARQAEQEMRQWLADINDDQHPDKPMSLEEALQTHQYLEPNQITKPEYFSEFEFDIRVREYAKARGLEQSDTHTEGE